MHDHNHLHASAKPSFTNITALEEKMVWLLLECFALKFSAYSGTRKYSLFLNHTTILYGNSIMYVG